MTRPTSTPAIPLVGLALTLLVAAMALVGCAEPDEAPDVDEADLVAIEIEPKSSLTAVGEPRRFEAFGIEASGARRPISERVTWALADPEIASVDPVGDALGARAGATTLTARLDDLSAEAALVVVPSPVVALGLTPETPRVDVGESVHLTVTALFADDSSGYVTPSVTWRSEDPAVASVEDARVTGLAPGQALMIARIGQVEGSILVQVVSPTP